MKHTYFGKLHLGKTLYQTQRLTPRSNKYPKIFVYYRADQYSIANRYPITIMGHKNSLGRSAISLDTIIFAELSQSRLMPYFT